MVSYEFLVFIYECSNHSNIISLGYECGYNDTNLLVKYTLNFLFKVYFKCDYNVNSGYVGIVKNFVNLSSLLYNDDTYLIAISLINSIVLTTIMIYLILGLEKISLWFRIYLVFIIWFVLYILFLTYVSLISDSLNIIIDTIFNSMRYLYYLFLIKFMEPMILGGELECLSFADWIVSPMNNPVAPPGWPSPPSSPAPSWPSRPVTPEGIVAVRTPSNIPSFDPSIWRKGEIPTPFAESRAPGYEWYPTCRTDPAIVGYYPGRSTDRGIMVHVLQARQNFNGPIYPFTYIESTIDKGTYTVNIWVKPGRDVHMYYINKEDYNLWYEDYKSQCYADEVRHMRNMTPWQRLAYADKTAKEEILYDLKTLHIPRMLNGHQIPIANTGC